ncbi:MAG: glycosyltransferase, partial [Patescibacteria group bacterium]
AANNRIVTPGFVSDQDLVGLYSGAAVFVHPSLYEGFGLMILEALACGAPVVSSNTSSLPEVVGDAGLLVPAQNPSLLAAAIKQVLSNQRLADALRAKGLERVKQFSWRQTAEQTLALYQKTLN